MEQAQMQPLTFRKFANPSPPPPPEEESPAQIQILDGLTAFIMEKFSEAMDFKDRFVTNRLLQSDRQVRGEYEPDKLAKIQKLGGSETFWNVTASKCNTFVAWVMSELNLYRKKPFKLTPTPVPSLPDEDLQNILLQVNAQLDMVAQTTGQFAGEGDIQAATDAAIEAFEKKARERIEKMEKVISDQLIEGGFYDALEQVLRDMAVFPFCVLKGPVIRASKTLKWENKAIVPKVILRPEWYGVSPYDILWDPHACNIGEGYIIEIVTWDPSQLYDMRGAEGYNTKAIDAVLAAGPGGNRVYRQDSTGASTIATLQHQPQPVGDTYTRDRIESLEFWGAVQGQLLREWGMPEEKVPDATKYYDVCALLVGEHVVRAILNPDPLGEKPYYSTSYKKMRGVLGAAIPDLIRHLQNAHNATRRALMNNQAFASLSMMSADMSVLSADDVKSIRNHTPGKVFLYNGTNLGSSARKPVEWFQPQDNSASLLNTSAVIQNEIDDASLVPRFASGAPNTSGAATTSSGLAQLTDMFGKGTGDSICNLDRDVIGPSVTRTYRYNLRTHPDDAIKGDAQVIPGTAQQNIQYRQALRYQLEFLDRTNNPMDIQITGIEGRRRVHEAAAELLQIPPHEVVPTTEELARRMQSEAQAAVQPMGSPRAIPGDGEPHPAEGAARHQGQMLGRGSTPPGRNVS